jgi:hypothetical protein
MLFLPPDEAFRQHPAGELKSPNTASRRKMMITRETQVEEIVNIPGVISYFIQNGISPITCSGAYSQTLGRLLEIKKAANPDEFIDGLNNFLNKRKKT